MNKLPKQVLQDIEEITLNAIDRRDRPFTGQYKILDKDGNVLTIVTVTNNVRGESRLKTELEKIEEEEKEKETKEQAEKTFQKGLVGDKDTGP